MTITWKATVVLALAAASAVSGCRTQSTSENAIPPELAGVPPEVLAEGHGIKLLSVVDMGRLVGPVDVEACQKVPTDPQANEAHVLALLKQAAAKRGAEGLIRVAYAPGTNPGCIASMKGSAVAVMAP